MVNKKNFFLGIILCLVFSGSAFANPFRDCGVGAAIFPDNGTAATLSNIIFDLGTTALSSGVSSPGTCSGKEVKTAQFIHDTYPNVEEDTVLGGGDYTVAMLDVMGCDKNSHQAIVTSVRRDFVKYEVEGPESYYDVLQNTISSEYKDACST